MICFSLVKSQKMKVCFALVSNETEYEKSLPSFQGEGRAIENGLTAKQKNNGL